MKSLITRLYQASFKLLLIACLFCGITTIQAQTYPFTLPTTVVATLNVTTTSTEPANNKLLGANIAGFSSTVEKDLIRKFDPTTLRFPSGVWINWYDYEVDGNRVYDDYVAANYKGVLDYTYINQINSNLGGKTGFPGLTALNTEKKQVDGKGFDMLWGYNLNYDSNTKSIARLRDSEANGFEVKYIEMGNEQFYANQRSNRISTPQKYVAVAKSLSSELHRIRPDIKVSVPLAWRTEPSYVEYNQTLTADDSYFDAVSIHKYVGSDPDIPASFTYADVIAGRLLLERDVNYARKLANTKPVWLSEWGVSAGSDCQAAAALGMADCYLFLFENQHIYDRADWYCVNGLLNSFVTVTDKRVPKYPLEKLGYGSVHEIMRSVIENSTLLKSVVYTSKLTTELGSINAVSARAVTKWGKTSVIAVNLTNKTVPFTLKFDGVAYTGSFKHDALKFSSLSANPILGIDDNPLSLVKSGTGQILLPPFSVNKISDLTIEKTYPVVRMQKGNETDFAIDGGNGGIDNQPVVLWPNRTNENQQWVEIDRGGGYYSYQKLNTDFCIDGGNGGTDDQLVKLYTTQSANQNQHWKKISVGNNKYVLEKRNAVGFSIDGGNVGFDGSQLKLWKTNTSNGNQQWLFSTVGQSMSLVKSSPISNENMETNLANVAISAFSNQATNQITVNGIDVKNCAINMYSSTGKLLGVYANSNVIAVSNLPKGVYMLKIKSNTINKSVKFIK